jgi:hypothetical protein
LKGKIILDLCGGTGAWSKPYKDAGYDVKVITLPMFDVTKVEFEENWLRFYRQDIHWTDWETIDCREVCGILAAPPCTEFTLAKGSQPRNFESAMEVVQACLRIVWHCRFAGGLKFWAMENPVGFLRQFLGRPAYTFEQWQFGDDGIKPTDLWGYFNPPKPTVKDKPDKLARRYPNGRTNGGKWSAPKCPPEYKHLNLNRAARRAITPPGFAKAFAKANK